MATDDLRGRKLSADERLALVQELERREAGAVRKAAGAAWLSLALVAVLFAALVFGTWAQLRRMRSEVAQLNDQQSALIKDIEVQKGELAEVERNLRDKQAALTTLIGAIRRTDTEARGGLETALDADPRAAVLVPRVYVHIVSEQDRQWARNLGDRLQHGGVIPLGIERVPGAAALKQFEVRYYKKAEEDGAKRILSILDNFGVPAVPVYLNLENDTRVRTNHFEIWCPDDARRFKLAPLPTATQ
jgi:hypothetical protein